MEITYENQYGKVVLEPTEYIAIKDIRCPADDYLFPIEIAEKIVLITDNRSMQICPAKFDDLNRGFYVIHHESCSVGSVCKVAHLNFISNRKPADLIREAARVYTYSEWFL